MMQRVHDEDSQYQNAVFLKQLFVDPFFQHQGIGRCMINHLLEEAREEKKNSVILWVLEKNLPARSFYEKFGFALNGDKKTEAGTSEFLFKYIKSI